MADWKTVGDSVSVCRRLPVTRRSVNVRRQQKQKLMIPGKADRKNRLQASLYTPRTHAAPNTPSMAKV